MKNLKPVEIVTELDRYVIGQYKAKRAVAVALRNRWRRRQVPPELCDEIATQKYHPSSALQVWVKPKSPVVLPP